MARSWSELLGDAEGPQETDEQRAGFFGRLRDSLGKSRRALTGELAAATFDPGNDEDWERLEEALIQGDVGVRATAELVAGSRRATSSPTSTRRSRRRSPTCSASRARSTFRASRA